MEQYIYTLEDMKNYLQNRIKLEKGVIFDHDYEQIKMNIKALEIAIKTLEQPSVTSQTKYEDIAKAFQCGIALGFAKKYDEMDKIIDEIKKIAPQPKAGRWIIKDNKEPGYDIAGVKTWYIQIMCSECGFVKTAIEGHTGQYHYCPNCGAKMQEVKDD